MKKPTRTQRRAMIENGKTIAIIALCLCCVFLLCSIFDLYKGQVSIGQAFWGAETAAVAGNTKGEDVIYSYRGLTEPEIIMVGQANARAVLPADSQEYERATNAVNEIMENVYTRPAAAFEVAEPEMWQTVLAGGIIYVKYPCMVATAFEKPFATPAESAVTGSIKKYRDVLIAPSTVSDRGVTVFIKDGDTLQNIKIGLDVSAKEIKSIIDGYSGKRNSSFVFAKELNLDTPRTEVSEDGVVLLDSMFLIPLEPIAANNVITYVPDTYTQGIGFSHNNDFAMGLLNVFGYNPNTVRQYSNNNGAMIFVGDTGSLGLHPEGRIEYKALGANEGISLITAARTGSDSREIISGLTGMINSVFSICGVNGENTCANLRITEMPDMTNPNEMNIKMEYFTDNRRIVLGENSAVQAKIKNGVLVELKISVKTVEKSDRITSSQDIFPAIDMFCEKNPQCSIVRSGSLVYEALEDDKEISAIWKIQGE